MSLSDLVRADPIIALVSRTSLLEKGFHHEKSRACVENDGRADDDEDQGK